jgi:hypothetical protein
VMSWLGGELERLCAPDYLSGLDGRSLDGLRAMRDECNRAETALSYVRRVVQGRLDVVQGILAGAGSEHGLAGVVENLSSIIGGGPPRPAGPGRLPAQLAPDMEAVESGDLTEEVDAVLDPGRIGELSTMSADDLRGLAARLVELEGRVSADRRALHERIDTVQGEIVSRYKSGQASPDGLLT